MESLTKSCLEIGQPKEIHCNCLEEEDKGQFRVIKKVDLIRKDKLCSKLNLMDQSRLMLEKFQNSSKNRPTIILRSRFMNPPLLILSQNKDLLLLI